ncbi:DMT family transporter [Paracoccus sp. MBLB3053]|uniref:DMT family transporter n=1 Tax=Paracoccus aurantius TaxID=3073814 RepID=A0ABU2HWA5_9RHOB|nr:DMT family transporter [Paracoccus sp. MBLB3053]MDS9469333.1 DMT family transporter [Paracoccus sp. MBLB3053]
MTELSPGSSMIEEPTPFRGILLCTSAYGLLSLQDAAMKWLVDEQSVTVSLFWRSASVLLVCLVLGRGAMIGEIMRSQGRGSVVFRAFVSIIAWILYYSAARHLDLAEMTTLYFSAPVMVIVLAAVVLKERANRLQWMAVMLGFIGVVVAARPDRISEPRAAAMVLLAAMLWAYGYILLRQLQGRMTVGSQVLLTNLVFVIVTGITLPWQGGLPGADQIGLMALVGLVGGLGQFALFASFTRTSATVLAPFEYTGLIWAYLLSTAIWGAPPSPSLIAGALFISVSGVLGIYGANRLSRARRSRPARMD